MSASFLSVMVSLCFVCVIVSFMRPSFVGGNRSYIFVVVVVASVRAVVVVVVVVVDEVINGRIMEGIVMSRSSRDDAILLLVWVCHILQY